MFLLFSPEETQSTDFALLFELITKILSENTEVISNEKCKKSEYF